MYSMQKPEASSDQDTQYGISSLSPEERKSVLSAGLSGSQGGSIGRGVASAGLTAALMNPGAAAATGGATAAAGLGLMMIEGQQAAKAKQEEADYQAEIQRKQQTINAISALMNASQGFGIG